MHRHICRKLALIGAVGALIAACGGGSTDLAEGGIGGTGISTGTVTDFGSVWVNGVEFETDQATIRKEGMEYKGQGMDRQQLRIGMVVTVRGDIDADGMRGTANTIEYSSLLRGYVDLPPSGTTLRVMGQEVRVDASTRYQGLDRSSDLTRGDKVEVSGFYVHDSTGSYVQATYIERITETLSEYKVSGIVDEVENGEFSIGDLQEIYCEDNCQVAAGDYVEVLIRPSRYELNEYVAISVTSRTAGLGVSEMEKAEMEGIVTGSCTTLPCTFKLGLQEVQVTADTSFEKGGFTDIYAGVRLEVEGSVSNGVLIASEVDFED